MSSSDISDIEHEPQPEYKTPIQPFKRIRKPMEELIADGDNMESHDADAEQKRQEDAAVAAAKRRIPHFI